MKGILFKSDVWKAKMRVLEQYGEAQTRRLSGLELLNRNTDTAGCPNSPDDYRLMGFDGKVADFARGAMSFEELKVSVMYHCKPRYQVGEVVYIKEAYCDDCPDEMGICYKLGRENQPASDFCDKWKSPLFMPKVAARYFIQITDVKPQRLQEITDVDAIREGIPNGAYAVNPRKSYEVLWDSINPKYPWSSNRWVWVYTFKKALDLGVEANIEAAKKVLKEVNREKDH